MKNGSKTLNKKIKIYLSKSRQGTMDSLMKVREYILKYENIELLEYTGGDYSTALLEQADYMLVLPYEEAIKKDNYTFNVGKGQYDEILFATNEKIPIKPIISLTDDIIISMGIASKKVVDLDWQRNYGMIQCYSNKILPFDLAIPALVKKKVLTSNYKQVPMLACSI